MSNLLSLSNNAKTNKTGFSYNIARGEEAPSHGYMASMDGLEMKVLKGHDLIEQIKIYAMFNMDILSDEETYLGCWYDHNTETFYLDVSLHFETLEEAIAYGLSNNQSAVWDLSQNRSIDL